MGNIMKLTQQETTAFVGGFAGRQRLLADNERLRGDLARAKDAAGRYAVLIREGDHRIKNSLQVVASLMQLQARRERSPTAQDALEAASARVRVIAGIHDALQLSGGADRIDLGAMLQTMSERLQEMAGDARNVTILVNVEPIETSATFAQPIALAVNELVINALRHAYPRDRGGAIRVGVTRDANELRIIVADGGRGVPNDHLEGLGYGMSLVRAMMKQVGGAVHVANDCGARFTLTAPIPV